MSAVFQRKLPPKCQDPDVFSVPCKIRNICFDKAMLDLGASINVMPRSIYDKLNLGELKKTGIVIQLADRSNAYPDGVLEDVLVQVNELVFPANFYVMNIGEACHDIPILLGRPFLKTARTKIDMHEGTLTMKFDSEVIKFNIFDAMRFPSDVNYLYALDVFDELSQDVYDLSHEDELFTVLTKSHDHTESQKVPYQVNDNLDEVISSLSYLLEHDGPNKLELSEKHAKLLLSSISPPKLELKPLPDNLKYAYLGDNETLPVIISSALTLDQEEKLLKCLENIAKL